MEPGLFYDCEWNEVHRSLDVPSLSEFFDYPIKDEKKLSKLLKIKKVQIDPCAVFVVHSYLQDARCD